ncbi:hypothetical protein PSH47_04950 [Pseudoalteromonas sp. CST5]|uniref:hypothetical protein n=1 Tax=unclassified Pseudoalteromonas TaxID=194690 RepID=UPI002358A875|nr:MULTISPECIES: hypothetical protein [unclassified Pseudoalteromonas]MDC9513090.1 hypothetical protein [Pseudoalteromonas sp. CST1]MDC9537173.1 hypothetical protein [Pseudoalteromonas sp. CST3]MDC9541487.1 hypothetical protein [Pseudoalteromonas sp. CST2]MDC9545766.1 hypothetical protein [Pseudoalteromonas sp. CST4]MDC9548518.1 hypothetical protein [Pseudoalteromonas sp. CST5]
MSPYKWQAEMCIKLRSGANTTHYLDFNRIRFRGIPPTKRIKELKGIEFAHRDDLANEFQNVLSMLRLEKSDATISNYYYKFTYYLKWCDSLNMLPIEQSTIQKFCIYCYERYRTGELKSSAYITFTSTLKVIFSNLEINNASEQWLNNIVILSNNDTQPHEAYTNSDLKQMLPFLRSLFKQTAKQFITSPEQYMAASKRNSPMLFEWKGEAHKIYLAVNKMMIAATFLLSYYTFSNTTQILKLRRPKSAGLKKENWYVMSAFKRRAFKVINIEIGEHHIDIPKYCIDFFNTLLEVSKVIDNSDDAPLIQACWENKKTPLNNAFLRDFNSIFIKNSFPMYDSTGKELRFSVSRFRATGSYISQLNSNEIETAILLNNTPRTVKRHYSEGNKLENNIMMQQAALIRAEQAKNLTTIDKAKENLDIKILKYEELQEQMTPQIKQSAHGSYCDNPFGEKSKKFSKKVSSYGLHELKLACADLLGCFGCDHQVIVQSVEDIWCLLSFKECIEESLYFHLNAKHFDQNFSKVLNYIDQNILPKIAKKIIADAEVKLTEEGRHPLWLTPDSLPTVK